MKLSFPLPIKKFFNFHVNKSKTISVMPFEVLRKISMHVLGAGLSYPLQIQILLIRFLLGVSHSFGAGDIYLLSKVTYEGKNCQKCSIPTTFFHKQCLKNFQIQCNQNLKKNLLPIQLRTLLFQFISEKFFEEKSQCRYGSLGQLTI